MPLEEPIDLSSIPTETLIAILRQRGGAAEFRPPPLFQPPPTVSGDPTVPAEEFLDRISSVGPEARKDTPTDRCPPMPEQESTVPPVGSNGLMDGHALRGTLEQLVAGVSRIESTLDDHGKRLGRVEMKTDGLTKAAQHWGDEVVALKSLVESRHCTYPKSAEPEDPAPAKLAAVSAE